jgi:hypothetical protein
MRCFQTYASTEGLDRFPANQRFWVWRGAHKRLKAGDPAYRARCRAFAVKIVVTSVIYCMVATAPGWLRRAGVRLSDTLDEQLSYLAILCGIVYTLYVVIASFRQQAWQNARVAEEIKRS